MLLLYIQSAGWCASNPKVVKGRGGTADRGVEQSWASASARAAALSGSPRAPSAR